jgi:hypothetical protein
MSYNGSGTFNINTAGQPVVTGTVISSTAFNALTADLGTGLSTAITKDGQTIATAKIPFALGISINGATSGVTSVLATDAVTATITLPSATGTLANYAEGTWTPVVVGSSTAGTATYVTQVGYYTKIGKNVYITATIDYNSGTGTGNLLVNGLPFTSAATYLFVLPLRQESLTLSANSVPQCLITSSSTQINFQQIATGTSSIASVVYDAAAYLNFSGCYVAAS